MAVKQEESFELVHEIFQLKTSGQIASLPAAQGNYTAYNIHVLSSTAKRMQHTCTVLSCTGYRKSRVLYIKYMYHNTTYSY